MQNIRTSFIFKHAILIAALLLVFVSQGCSRRGDKKEAKEGKEAPVAEQNGQPAVARVNGSAISLDDFKSYVADRPFAGIKESPQEALEMRLQEMITVEVLYQEAMSLKMDEDPKIRQIVRQLLAQKLIDEQVIRPVREREITEAELQQYYDDHIDEFVRPERVRLADIFIAVPDNSTPETREEKRKKAEEAFAEVTAPQKGRFFFGEAIAKFSDQPDKYQKGDTGYFDREGKPIGLEKEVVDAAFTLSKNGEMYDRIIETPAGFHIIMLVGKNAAQSRSLKEVAPQLEQRIRNEELAAKRESYIRALKDRAEVSVEEQALEELAADIEKSGIERAEKGGRSLTPPPFPGK